MYKEGPEDNPNIKIALVNYEDECSFRLFELVEPNSDLFDNLAAHDIDCDICYRGNTESLCTNSITGFAHMLMKLVNIKRSVITYVVK